MDDSYKLTVRRDGPKEETDRRKFWSTRSLSTFAIGTYWYWSQVDI